MCVPAVTASEPALLCLPSKVTIKISRVWKPVFCFAITYFQIIEPFQSAFQACPLLCALRYHVRIIASLLKSRSLRCHTRHKNHPVFGRLDRFHRTFRQNAARQVTGDKTVVLSHTKRCIWAFRTNTLPVCSHNRRMCITAGEMGPFTLLHEEFTTSWSVRVSFLPLPKLPQKHEADHVNERAPWLMAYVTVYLET